MNINNFIRSVDSYFSGSDLYLIKSKNKVSGVINEKGNEKDAEKFSKDNQLDKIAQCFEDELTNINSLEECQEIERRVHDLDVMPPTPLKHKMKEVLERTVHNKVEELARLESQKREHEKRMQKEEIARRDAIESTKMLVKTENLREWEKELIPEFKRQGKFLDDGLFQRIYLAGFDITPYLDLSRSDFKEAVMKSFTRHTHYIHIEKMERELQAVFPGITSNLVAAITLDVLSNNIRQPFTEIRRFETQIYVLLINHFWENELKYKFEKKYHLEESELNDFKQRFINDVITDVIRGVSLGQNPVFENLIEEKIKIVFSDKINSIDAAAEKKLEAAKVAYIMKIKSALEDLNYIPRSNPGTAALKSFGNNPELFFDYILKNLDDKACSRIYVELFGNKKGSDDTINIRAVRTGILEEIKLAVNNREYKFENLKTNIQKQSEFARNRILGR